MKKLVKNLVKVLVLAGVLVGGLMAVCNLVEWVLGDSGRYLLAVAIGAYAIYRMFKAEFEG